MKKAGLLGILPLLLMVSCNDLKNVEETLDVKIVGAEEVKDDYCTMRQIKMIERELDDMSFDEIEDLKKKIRGKKIVVRKSIKTAEISGVCEGKLLREVSNTSSRNIIDEFECLVDTRNQVGEEPSSHFNVNGDEIELITEYKADVSNYYLYEFRYTKYNSNPMQGYYRSESLDEVKSNFTDRPHVREMGYECSVAASVKDLDNL
jgi:hypothetical protein